ncbi:hypothetical protein KK120_11620 [Virgibacillus dakarensis]|nr:hypothetical protein [Virgibacillus dakarensis]
MKIQNKDLEPAIQEVKAAMHGLKDLKMFKRSSSHFDVFERSNLSRNRRTVRMHGTHDMPLCS